MLLTLGVEVSTQLIPRHSVPNRAARALARAARDRRVLAGAAATAGAALAAGVAREVRTSDEDPGAGSYGPYRIKGRETASAGVVRVAQARLDHAFEQLRHDVLEEDAATAIHEARKDLKKTRAVLRLVRDQLGKERYRRANARLRDASRALSGSRDATVKSATLEALAERYGDELPGGLRELRRELKEEQRAVETSVGDRDSETRVAVQRAAELIAAANEDIDEWAFSKSGFKLFAAGLERTYGRGHQRFADVRGDPTAENVHEWRKRVKDLWYDFRLLRDTWPPILGGMADEAHELSDLLGDHHDLTVLSGDLDGRAEIDGDEALTAHALIDGRQEELLEAAVPIGERLYAESPKAFVKRLHGYWRARDAG
jgi:CHAD domain-containing protein